MEGGCCKFNSDHSDFCRCQFLHKFWSDIDSEPTDVTTDHNQNNLNHGGDVLDGFDVKLSRSLKCDGKKPRKLPASAVEAYTLQARTCGIRSRNRAGKWLTMCSAGNGSDHRDGNEDSKHRKKMNQGHCCTCQKDGCIFNRDHSSSEVYISNPMSDDKKVDFGMSIVSVPVGRKERHFTSISYHQEEPLAVKFDIRSFDEIMMIDTTVLVGKSNQEVLKRFLKVEVGKEFELVFRRYLPENDSFDYYAISGKVIETSDEDERPTEEDTVVEDGLEPEVDQIWVTNVKRCEKDARFHLYNQGPVMLESVASKNNSKDLRYMCVHGNNVDLNHMQSAHDDDFKMTLKVYGDVDILNEGANKRYCLIEHDEDDNVTTFVNTDTNESLSADASQQTDDHDIKNIQDSIWFIPHCIDSQTIAYENEKLKGEYLWCHHDKQRNLWQLQLKKCSQVNIDYVEAVQFNVINV